MAFCFSGSLLRANINIVFFLFNIVIVRGKKIFFLLLLHYCVLFSSTVMFSVRIRIKT